MKRPLAILGGILLVGTRVSFFFSPTQCLQLAAAGVLTGILFYLSRTKWGATATLVCLTLTLGFLFGGRYQSTKLQPFLEAEGEVVAVTGLVEDVRKTSSHNQRYELSGDFDGMLPKATIVVRDYSGADLEVGETVTLLLELRQPRYKTSKDYYSRVGIPTEGIVLGVNARSWEATGWFSSLLQKRLWAREQIKQKLHSNLPAESAALVGGMVFGMTEDIPASLYRDLNRAGTSHLLSVSGLHLSIITGGVLLLLEQLRLSKKLSAFIAMLVAVVFTFLVGASPPILRSLVMSLIFLLAQMLQEQSDSLTSLGASGVVICLIWPYWTLSLGLWLSFGATLGIVTVGVKLQKALKERYPEGKGLLRFRSGILTGLSISAGAYLFTFPLLVLDSGFLPLISPLANLLIAPFSTIVVLGGGLLGVLPAGSFLYRVLAVVVHLSGQIILEVSKQLANLPFAGVSINSGGLFLAFLLCLFIVVVVAVVYRATKKNYALLGVLLSIALLASAKGFQSVPQNKQIAVTFFPESETVVFRRGSHGVVVHPPDRYGMGQLIQFLEFSGINKIDLLVMPENQGNVDSGLLELYQSTPVGAVISSGESVEAQLLSEYLPGVPVYEGENLESSFLGAAVLHLVSTNVPLEFTVGSQKMVLTKENYAIIHPYPKDAVVGFSENAIWLPTGLAFIWNPLEQRIFGARTLAIPVSSEKENALSRARIFTLYYENLLRTIGEPKRNFAVQKAI